MYRNANQSLEASRSATCLSRQSGKPLMDYWSEGEATLAADRATDRVGRRFVPYRCRACGAWHISPADRHTSVVENANCGCQGRDGRDKDAYRTEEDALRRAEIIYEEEGIWLRAYECPYSEFWHLTSRGGF